MNATQYAGEIVAAAAVTAADAIIKDPKIPQVSNQAEALKLIHEIVFQDKTASSKRIWAGVLGFSGMILGAVTLYLMTPTGGALAGPHTPFLVTILGTIASGASGLSALLSKSQDVRPVNHE